jgi:type VI secretion system FHA domain protein
LQTELDPRALAELAGAMLREATAGTMAALLGRSLTKRESRIDVTMLARQANNPLKFFPDADMALAQMLGRRSSAYLSPVRAFNHAYDDLRAHELAVLAAMRAALQEVLEQVSPRAIEQKLPQDSALDKLFSGSRKARLWDCLVAGHARMSVDANDKFSRSFNEQFALAYEQQMSQIRKAKR